MQEYDSPRHNLHPHQHEYKFAALDYLWRQYLILALNPRMIIVGNLYNIEHQNLIKLSLVFFQ